MVPFCRLNSAYAFTLKCVFKWLHVFFGVCSYCEFHDVFSLFPFLESGFRASASTVEGADRWLMFGRLSA